MRVLLIYPGSHYNIVTPPLGLMAVAAYIRKAHPDWIIEIKDFRLDRMSGENAAQYVARWAPDIAGIYGIPPDTAFFVDIARSIRPHVRSIVAGGPLATVFPQYVLENCPVDYLVMGEGEIPFARLLAHIEKGDENVPAIPRVIQAAHSDIVYDASADLVNDLDTLPFPAWDMIDVERYFSRPSHSMNPVIGRKRVLPIMTSRGCPFTCSYCHNMMGKKFRARSVANIISELELLIRDYGIEAVEIWDDIANMDPGRMEELCNVLIEKQIKLAISFSPGLRADLLTEELVDKMLQAGTKRINFGIETCSQRIQKITSKVQDLEKIKKISHYISKKKGVILGGFFIIGNPTETEREIKSTLAFARSLPIDIISINICTPFPGTRMFERLPPQQREELRRLPPHRFSFFQANFSVCEVTPERLLAIQRRGYLGFYMSPRRLFSIFRKVSMRESMAGAFEVLRFALLPKYRILYQEA